MDVAVPKNEARNLPPPAPTENTQPTDIVVSAQDHATDSVPVDPPQDRAGFTPLAALQTERIAGETLLSRAEEDRPDLRRGIELPRRIAPIMREKTPELEVRHLARQAGMQVQTIRGHRIVDQGDRNCSRRRLHRHAANAGSGVPRGLRTTVARRQSHHTGTDRIISRNTTASSPCVIRYTDSMSMITY